MQGRDVDSRSRGNFTRAHLLDTSLRYDCDLRRPKKRSKRYRGVCSKSGCYSALPSGLASTTM
jgi:hypothetical protein